MSKKKEQWEEIQIAFDRRNSLYVAYSTETGIVATGVCVQSAVTSYKENYLQRSDEHSIFNERVGAEY